MEDLSLTRQPRSQSRFPRNGSGNEVAHKGQRGLNQVVHKGQRGLSQSVNHFVVCILSISDTAKVDHIL